MDGEVATRLPIGSESGKLCQSNPPLNTLDSPAPTNEPSRFKRHKPGTKEQAFKMYARHTDLAAISSKLGVPLATLRKWSSVGTWRARRLFLESANPLGASVHKPGGKEAETDEAFEQLKALSFSEKQSMYEEMASDSAMRAALVMQRASDATLVSQAEKISKMDSTARKALRLETRKPSVVVNVALLSGAETRRSVACPVTREPLAIDETPAIQAVVIEVPSPHAE
jgi:hypothetical protein